MRLKDNQIELRLGNLWESRVIIFRECVEQNIEIRYNNLSDKCNLLKRVQAEEIKITSPYVNCIIKKEATK